MLNPTNFLAKLRLAGRGPHQSVPSPTIPVQGERGRPRDSGQVPPGTQIVGQGQGEGDGTKTRPGHQRARLRTGLWSWPVQAVIALT